MKLNYKKSGLFFFISFFLIYSAVFSQTKSNCYCEPEQKEIVYNGRIIVCGYIEDSTSKSDTILYGLKVKDCLNDSLLLDFSDNENINYRIQRCNNELLLIQLSLIPDSSMKGLIETPLFFYSINNTYKVSTPFFCFKRKGLSNYQTNYIDNLCLQLKSKETIGHKQNYPFDEFSLYCLFFGAINENNQALLQYKNLDKYFIFDGALAETKDEIPFEYIISHNKPISICNINSR